MPQATVMVKSNDGLIALSEAYPESSFTVLGAWPDGTELRLLVETNTVEADSLDETVATLPEVHGFEKRHTGERRVLFETNTALPEPHGAIAASGVVPSFPLHLEDGWLVGKLVVSQSQLSAFRDELQSANIEHRITRISPEPEASELLTDRQREVVDAALKYGYYATPRECTITELAETLHVNKSVISRILHRAESQIITAYRSPSKNDYW